MPHLKSASLTAIIALVFISCKAASSADPIADLFYSKPPHAMAIYIATHGTPELLQEIADGIAHEISSEQPFNSQYARTVVKNACEETALKSPLIFCYIEVITDKHRIYSQRRPLSRPTDAIEDFDPYTWRMLTVGPDKLNLLAHILDCTKLRTESKA